jgi:hypothetical protein
MGAIALETAKELADVVERIARGEEVELTRGGAAVARVDRSVLLGGGHYRDHGRCAELIAQLRDSRRGLELGAETAEAVVEAERR